MDDVQWHSAAHMLALQTLTINLCRQLARSSPETAGLIQRAFDDSASGVESAAIVLGKRTPPEYCIEALRIVENMRSDVLGDPSKP